MEGVIKLIYVFDKSSKVEFYDNFNNRVVNQTIIEQLELTSLLSVSKEDKFYDVQKFLIGLCLRSINDLNKFVHEVNRLSITNKDDPFFDGYFVRSSNFTDQQKRELIYLMIKNIAHKFSNLSVWRELSFKTSGDQIGSLKDLEELLIKLPSDRLCYFLHLLVKKFRAINCEWKNAPSWDTQRCVDFLCHISVKIGFITHDLENKKFDRLYCIYENSKRGLLCYEGKTVRIKNKSLELLELLIENYPDYTEPNYILEKIYGKASCGDQSKLTSLVSSLNTKVQLLGLPLIGNLIEDYCLMMDILITDEPKILKIEEPSPDIETLYFEFDKYDGDRGYDNLIEFERRYSKDEYLPSPYIPKKNKSSFLDFMHSIKHDQI